MLEIYIILYIYQLEGEKLPVVYAELYIKY